MQIWDFVLIIQAMERKGLEMNTDSAVKQEDTTDGRENPVRTPISRPGIERDVVSCVNEIVSSSSCLQVFNGLSGRPVDEWEGD